MNRIFIGILLISLSGYAYAEVAHPENPNIVGGIFSTKVCFNNDGAVASDTECDQTGVDEGLLVLGIFQWGGVALSGINGCGTSAVNPVSSATCPFVEGETFTPCQSDQYVLVQTTISGHYWAVLANSNCTAIALPESTALIPCRLTDAFDPVTGCATINPPVFTVEDGYIKMGSGRAPPDSDCTDSTHIGRMAVDGVNDLIYVCTPTGWSVR